MAATETSLLLSSSSAGVYDRDNGVYDKGSGSVSKSDHEGSPNRWRIHTITFLLLMTAMFERFTHHSLIGNLVLFCTDELRYSSTIAVTINLSYTAITYFIPPFGGRIADTVSSRFNTVYASLLIYLVGVFLLPFAAFDYATYFGYDDDGLQYGLPLDCKRGYYLFGLLLTAIGAGALKANITPLGAQQVEPLKRNAVHSFFNWYYWCLNVGGFAAYLGISYVQEQMGFFIGYLIPAAFLFLGLVFFLIPRNYYLEHKRGSMAGEVIGILWEGCLYKTCKTKESKDRRHSCLDSAKISKGGHYDDTAVNHLKYVTKTIPIFLTLILFDMFTSQSTTTMLLQGERMNAQVGTYMIPVASLNAFKMATTALLIPALDMVIYPLLNHFHRKPTLLQRIGFGLILSVGSLVYMGILEIARKNDLQANGGIMQNVGISVYNASSISILLQVPQFLFIGAAETFTSMTAMEFAYTESPVAMQGLTMGLNHLATCFGNLVGTAIYNLIADTTANSGKPWLPDDINNGYLEYFVFFLAGLLLLNFFVFVILARRYRYCRLGTQQPLNPNTLVDNQTSVFEENHT